MNNDLQKRIEFIEADLMRRFHDFIPAYAAPLGSVGYRLLFLKPEDLNPHAIWARLICRYAMSGELHYDLYQGNDAVVREIHHTRFIVTTFPGDTVPPACPLETVDASGENVIDEYLWHMRSRYPEVLIGG